MEGVPLPESTLKFEVLDRTIQTAELMFHIAEDSYPNGSPWTSTQFEESIQSIYMHIAGLFKKEICIGFVAFFELGGQAEIYHVAIVEEEKYKGHGTWFLNELILYLFLKEVDLLFLEVRISNAAAIKLYEKRGFKKTGKRLTYYTNPVEDAWIMSLEKVPIEENI